MINEQLKERYIYVFRQAKEFLLGSIRLQISNAEEALLKHTQDQAKYDTLNDAHGRLIVSMSNRNMMFSVIGFPKREVKMKEILFNYDPVKILETYKDGDTLLAEFAKNFEGIDITRKGNLWKQFADGIISGSIFMSAFKDNSEFDAFVKRFSLNTYTKAALPMLLEKEIKGFGFALACDFIKELGYRDYAKPDVHIIEIFYGVGLCKTKDPYESYKAIIEMSQVVGEDAYTVDKIFRLIGSGNLYINNIKLGNNRDKFISSIMK